jgi:hypothetical protein
VERPPLTCIENTEYVCNQSAGSLWTEKTFILKLWPASAADGIVSSTKDQKAKEGKGG